MTQAKTLTELATSAQPPVDASTPKIPTIDQVDLETILDAWQTATDRLQATHELLREEVSRLSDELEVKNRELARKNRLADLGQMAAHVAHEVRNNLMPLTLYVSLLEKRFSADDEAIPIVNRVQSGLRDLESTVTDLLNFTSDHDPQKSDFPIETLLREVVGTLRLQLESQSIEATIHVLPATTVHADRNMMRRALLNLIMNAMDAMPDGGKLELKVACAPGRLTVSVDDTGVGLPSDSASLFDPFFTTKSEGTGLGLAIVERIAQAHNGSLTAQSRIGGGASFQLSFADDCRET